MFALREQHPSWGGRKLRRRLLDVGQQGVPAASTVTAILSRHGCLDPAAAGKPATTRFEHDRPNALWQMDFKGHFGLSATAQRCHQLTMLDDHSCPAVCVRACADEATGTVRDHLVTTFRRYGRPKRMNMDNGSPWGSGPGQPWTPLTVCLLQLGVGISHSRPYHPQTNGTLKRDVLHGRSFADLAACQCAFDGFAKPTTPRARTRR